MGLGSGGLSWSTSGLLLPVVQMLLLTVGTLGKRPLLSDLVLNL
jgi:hypothetical protein